jgi:hypothetical protein
VFGIGPATRIYLALGATDMRKGFEGLYGLVRDRIQLEPLSGHVFLFCNKARNRTKVLFWELEPGVSSVEVKAESERDQLKLPLKPRRKHPGRQELPAHLSLIFATKLPPNSTSTSQIHGSIFSALSSAARVWTNCVSFVLWERKTFIRSDPQDTLSLRIAFKGSRRA